MRRLAHVYIVPFLVLLAASCTNNTNKNADKKNTTPEQVSPFTGRLLDGLFMDTLPCADCSGIITALDLNGDSTFTLEQEYLDVKDGEHIFYQLGKWSAVDSILTLNEITEGPRQYKIIGPNELQTLDNEGVIITGSKLNYTLHRKTEKFTPKKNMSVRGMLAYGANNNKIKLCGWGKEYPLVVKPAAAMQMQAAFTPLKLKQGEKVLMEVEGKFSLPASQATGKVTDSFVVERFVKFYPGQKCKN